MFAHYFLYKSGCPDLNGKSPAPKAGGIAKLSYTQKKSERWELHPQSHGSRPRRLLSILLSVIKILEIESSPERSGRPMQTITPYLVRVGKRRIELPVSSILTRRHTICLLPYIFKSILGLPSTICVRRDFEPLLLLLQSQSL